MQFEIRLIDIIDIVLVSYLLYKTYKMLSGTVAIRLFIGILTFVVIWLSVSFIFQMQLLGGIMDQIVNVGVIGLIVLFQDEIRQFLTRVGSKNNIARFLGKIFSVNKNKFVESEIMQIVIACKNMSKEKVGALIVIQREVVLHNIEITGDMINATINSRLIENIFFKNSPLHDGAMIIANNKITAVACILPVTHSLDIPKELGLRHRAALGISEKTDVKAIIVSEETGRISVAENGRLKLNITPEELEAILSSQHENKK